MADAKIWKKSSMFSREGPLLGRGSHWSLNRMYFQKSTRHILLDGISRCPARVAVSSARADLARSDLSSYCGQWWDE